MFDQQNGDYFIKLSKILSNSRGKFPYNFGGVSNGVNLKEKQTIRLN